MPRAGREEFYVGWEARAPAGLARLFAARGLNRWGAAGR